MTAHPTRFSWNAGAWFGTQLGCTLWILLLGIAVIPRDLATGLACIATFIALTAVGIVLYRRRERSSPLAAIQAFLACVTVGTALVVVLANARGVADPSSPRAMVSTHLPYWAIACPLALMLFSFLIVKAGGKGSSRTH